MRVGMASRTHQPTVTVLEYHRLMDAIAARLDAGKREFSVNKLTDVVDLTDAQVHETLSHLSDKHEYVTDAGDGSWRISSDLED